MMVIDVDSIRAIKFRLYLTWEEQVKFATAHVIGTQINIRIQHYVDVVIGTPHFQVWTATWLVNNI